MKRFIYFAAVACVALAGCTKNEALVVEGNSDQLITFTSPVVGVPTKGIPTVEYPSTGKFHVVGKYHSGDYSTWDAATEYMNTDVAQISGEWVPVNALGEAQNYYWPTGDYDYRLTFIAYSPSTAAPTTINGSGLTYENYTIEPGSASVDLLYSHRTYNKTSSTANTGNIDGYDYTGTPYNGVNILFEHALSSINFDVKLADSYADNVIKLTGIALNGIAKQGTFSQGISDALISTEGVVADNSGVTWTLGTEVTGNYSLFSGDETLSSTEVFAIPEMCLIPQTLQDTKTVTITYTIENPAGVTVTCTKTVKLNGYTVTSWERGKKYIYHIIITLNRIYFAPEVVNWVTEPTGTITI